MLPLWKVYHPVCAYSTQDKKEFAEKVTAMYSGIPIPNFYVVMIFEAGELIVRSGQTSARKTRSSTARTGSASQIAKPIDHLIASRS
jgi:hypothetical protein